MGQTGYMQHTDLETLKADEYDAFIKDPYTFIVTKSLPRIFENLDTDSPRAGMILAEAMKAFYDHQAKFNAIKAPVFKKYGTSHLRQAQIHYVRRHLTLSVIF